MKMAFYTLVILLIGCDSNPAEIHWVDLPERRLSTYATALSEPVTSRFGTMPTVVWEYIKKMAPEAGFEGYEPTIDERALFQEYFDLLPVKYRNEMDEKVAKIYFVDNFDSGAMTDVVFNDKKEMFVVLYFNKKLLNTSLSHWINFRDNSSFKPKDGFFLDSNCTGDYFGLIHALLHEASHIYDYYHHITPYVEEFQRDTSPLKTTPFIETIWKDLRDITVEKNILGDSNYSGYGLGGKIDISMALDLYKKLKASPFASLYGTLSWSEDFAESFSWWYMKDKLGIDYSVLVEVDGKVVLSFEPFQTQSAKSRVSILEVISEI